MLKATLNELVPCSLPSDTEDSASTTITCSFDFISQKIAFFREGRKGGGGGRGRVDLCDQQKQSKSPAAKFSHLTEMEIIPTSPTTCLQQMCEKLSRRQ